MREKKEGNTPYIVMSTLTDMSILLPSLPEQQKIANFLSLFDEKIEIEKKILETLKNTKKGLLQQMFVQNKQGNIMINSRGIDIVSMPLLIFLNNEIY